MYNKEEFDYGKYYLPGHAKYPNWVEERIEGFRNELNTYAKQLGSLKHGDKDAHKVFVNLLQRYIIPEGITLKKKLTKSELNNLTKEYDRVLSDQDFVWYIWLLSNAGFLLSTVIPTSLDSKSLQLPNELVQKRKDINQVFKESGDKFKYSKDIENLAKEAIKWFEDNDNAIFAFIDSGANGSVTHIQELLVGIGFALNSQGQIIDTITNSLMDGVSQTDYFSNSSQAIQALYAKSAETAKPGYLGKKLSNALERIKLSSILDCGTKNKLKILTGDEKFLQSFVGMNFSKTKNGNTRIFKDEDIKSAKDSDVYFRTPLHCKSPGNTICPNCYNLEFINLMGLKAGDNIGLIATTGITGSLVNLTLKKSHTGVSVDRQEVDLIKDMKNM